MSTRRQLTARIVAKIIDLMIVMLAAALLPRIVGPLIGFFYSLLADGIEFGGFKGQSVGKKIMRLRVVNRAQQNSVASFKDSAIRNSPVGIATFFGIIPIWGWFILFLIGLPLMAIEIYLMARVEGGHRIGDVMADTEVIPA